MTGPPTRRLCAVVLALVVAAVPLSSATPATAAAGDFPTYSGAGFRDLYYASLPLPGTQRVTTRPAIYGDAAADRRIQSLAEARGYRLQVIPTVRLGTYGGLTLAPDAGQAWLALLAAARRHGTPLQGSSAYRSVADQRSIFTGRLGGYSPAAIARGSADRAIESVLSTSSIPGYSRHHSGKTIDLSHAGGSIGTFSSSAAYRWMAADNYRVAKTYGFIPNYPPGSGAQGPDPEPWEFGYLGTARIRCPGPAQALAGPSATPGCGPGVSAVLGAFDGDSRDDLLVHRPGAAAEGLHPGTASRQQAARAVSPVSGTYRPVAGRFDGDPYEDVLWHAPGSATDQLWRHRADGSHASAPRQVNGDYVPISGDFDGNGVDDVFWYAAGAAPDSLWYFQPGGGYRSVPARVGGAYEATAGDFDGNGMDDLFWHAPGGRQDYVWFHRRSGGYLSQRVQVNGAFDLAAGDFDGDGVDDVLFYAAGGAADYLWFQRRDRTHRTHPVSISGRFTLATGDHDGNGIDDVVFVAGPGAQDYAWFGGPTGFTRLPRSY